MPLPQGLTPPLPMSTLTDLLSYIEGDMFRGSRRMPLSDALLALTDKTLEAVPGLLRGHIASLRIALRQARQSQSSVIAVGGDGSGGLASLPTLRLSSSTSLLPTAAHSLVSATVWAPLNACMC